MFKVYRLLDPTLSLTSEPYYGILADGPAITTARQITASSYSDSSITISAPPPNPSLIVDSAVLFGIPLKFTVTGDSGDDATPLIQWGRYDAPRAFPIASVIDTLNVTFNNITISSQYRDIFPDLLHIAVSNEDEQNYYSMTASMTDKCQRYIELADSTLNPLGGYSNNGIPRQTKRGAFPVKFVTNNRTTAEFYCFFVEPFFMSPFTFQGKEEPGFFGIQTMDFNFNMGDLTRALSLSTVPGRIITSVAATMQNITQLEGGELKPTLFFKILTPKMPSKLSMITYKPYFQTDKYITEIGNVTAGNTTTVFSLTQTLNQIPGQMVIYLKRNIATRTPFTTDTYARIKALNLTWNNVTGNFGSWSERDLFLMSKKNGSSITWDQWRGPGAYSVPLVPAQFKEVSGVGSILIIRVGQDLGLGKLEAPGVAGQYQIQFSVTFENISSEDINYSLYFIPVNEGFFWSVNQTCGTSTSILTQTEVAAAGNYPTKPIPMLRTFLGGDFRSAFKNLAAKFVSGYEAAKPTLGTIANVASALSPGAAPVIGAVRGLAGFGLGGDLNEEGGEGGELMSRNELKRRAEELSNNSNKKFKT